MSNTNQLPKIGRPKTALTEKQVAELWAEYQERPFCIAQRAREIGVNRSTLAYYMRGGAAGIVLRNHWRSAVKSAHRAFNSGDRASAAAWFRVAAERIEKTNT